MHTMKKIVFAAGLGLAQAGLAQPVASQAPVALPPIQGPLAADTTRVTSDHILDQIIDTNRFRSGVTGSAVVGSTGPNAAADGIQVSPNGTVTLPEISTGVAPLASPLISVEGQAGVDVATPGVDVNVAAGAGGSVTAPGASGLPSESIVDQLISPQLLNEAAAGTLAARATTPAATVNAGAATAAAVSPASVHVSTPAAINMPGLNLGPVLNPGASLNASTALHVH